MRVVIDYEACTGHGRCYTLSPSLFDADEVGHSVPLDEGQLPDEMLEAARRAVANCPERAISLVDD